MLLLACWLEQLGKLLVLSCMLLPAALFCHIAWQVQQDARSVASALDALIMCCGNKLLTAPYKLFISIIMRPVLHNSTTVP